MPLADFTTVQKWLIQRFGSDQSVHDLPRVMRLPGFMHQKDEPFLSRIVSCTSVQPYPSELFLKLAGEAVTPPPSPPSSKSKSTPAGTNEGSRSRLNTEALQKLELWVPVLFPEAVQHGRIWRVSSAALGRDLEEDLSLSPEGIKDFGLHDIGDPREGKRTPIDVIVEHGGKTVQEAVAWLHLRLLIPGDRSLDNSVLAFLNATLREGIDKSVIIAAALDEARGNPIFEHVRENGGDEYVKQTIAKVLNELPATAEGKKRIIRYVRGERHKATDAMQRALIAAGCPVFYRGGVLVEPLWRWEKTGDHNRDILVTMLVKLNPSRLSYMTAKHAASFQKYNVRLKQWEPIDPPRDVVEQLLELGHWSFPTIKEIINSPTMRPDGSLLTTPGYDPATQLWYKSSGDIELPMIPDCPTRAEAEAALQLLQDLLKGFPFKDEVSKAVAIAGLMTPVLRGAFEFAPMFLILAPEAGSGKSYLVIVIGTLATGRAPVPLPMVENKDELDKRLTAAMFGAKPILHLNNLDFDLESGLLNQIITDGTVDIRPFGKNDQTISCDCRGTTTFANGNNIRIVGDLVRRTLTVRIDAKSEHPETRTFTFYPVEQVRADRGKYLAAIFTIVRAYIAAGRPHKDATALAGFSDWSRTVREPLIWLGLEDPVKSMEDNRANDPKREALRQRIEGLVAAFGTGTTFTAAEVHTKITATEQSPSGAMRASHPQLVTGFLRDDGKPISSKTVGNQLSKDLDRVSGGRRIECVVKDAHQGNRYRIWAETDRQEGPKPLEGRFDHETTEERVFD